MVITIKKKQAEAIGFKALAKFLGDKDAWGYREARDIDLVRMSDGNLDHLTGLIAAAWQDKKTTGLNLMLKDIGTWMKAKKEAGGLKARTLKHFESLLTRYLLKVPHHWVFEKDKDTEEWLPYFVEKIDYTPARESRGDYSPAHVDMELAWEEVGVTGATTVSFEEADVRGLTVVQAMAQKGYYAATPERLAAHLADVERWAELHPQIGRQCLCTGIGIDNVDGNPRDGRRDSWYWRATHDYPMVRNGDPAKVVVDLFNETRERDGRTHSVKAWFWQNEHEGRKAAGDEDGEDDDQSLDVDLDDTNTFTPEVPVHPNLVIFDLARHLRLRVHCRQLTEYEYDQTIADRLVLDDDRKRLVQLLIETRSGFQDIVKGKGGGAVVLLAGPPGTGKTLTAEVYAEAEQRALYSVQCSQLGTDPDSLEEELLKVFTRARRWNAVMLLDEADVYVHERGDNLHQNAIVGVFLRILEYQDAVLFLTTNRPDDVDDAIASRCIARLNYRNPDTQQLARIWRVLTESAGIEVDEPTIDRLTSEHLGSSGRDVKNLIKLAGVVGGKLDADTVAYVKQFQPTRGNR